MVQGAKKKEGIKNLEECVGNTGQQKNKISQSKSVLEEVKVRTDSTYDLITIIKQQFSDLWISWTKVKGKSVQLASVRAEWTGDEAAEQAEGH